MPCKALAFGDRKDGRTKAVNLKGNHVFSNVDNFVFLFTQNNCQRKCNNIWW